MMGDHPSLVTGRFFTAWLFLLGTASFAPALGGDLWEAKPISLDRSASTWGENPIQERWTLDVESGAAWKITNETPLDYTLAPTIISVRGSRHLWGKAFGGKWVVRPTVSVLAEAILEGPESRYLGFSASPSIEWWNHADSFSLFLQAGGGIGWIDSQDVPGAQGQDLTFNWFAKTGVRFRVQERWFLSAAIFFQHMSNRGMTDPNPGLDTLGGLVGISYAF